MNELVLSRFHQITIYPIYTQISTSLSQQYIMGFLQPLRKLYKLQVGTTQILQAEMLFNSSRIVLFFEDHIQHWDLDLEKKLDTSVVSESMYFWTVATPTGPTSFAYVCLENCEPSLGTFDFVDNKIVKLCDLPQEQENYTKAFTLGTEGYIALDARGKDHRLLIWDGKTLIDQKLDQNDNVEKFNSQSIVIFSSQNRVTGFEIQTGITDKKKFEIKGVEEGTILAVNEFGPNEAIIAVGHGSKTSSVLLYSLVSGQVLKTEKVDFQIDNFVRQGDGWVAICTTEDEGNSALRIQPCFQEGESSIVECEINRWIRYWNEYIPIITIAHHATIEAKDKDRCVIEVVRVAPKRSIYIKLLEDSGLVKEFGEEIVKATLNNF